MAMTWGATSINCYIKTYQPPAAEPTIAEIQLLPDPTDPDAVCSVLQQGGRKRKRIYWDGFVSNIASYNSLETDKLNGTQRTFVGPDGTNLNCIIQHLGPPRYVQSNLIEYSITLVEA